MQLTKQAKKGQAKKGQTRQGGAVRSLLSAASAGLLLAVPLAHAEGSSDEPWRVDVGTMRYSEKNRINVSELNFRAKRQLGEEDSLSVRADYDSVSGASPTGAAKIQTTSSASGGAPMASFKAARTAMGVDWDTSLTPETRLTLAADHSSQKTYSSAGLGGSVARDFNQRNTTLVFGASYSVDTIKPANGIHTELMTTNAATIRAASEEKSQVDLQLGITQVLTREALLQLNYVRGNASGYMTNPYKIISEVDPVTGVNANGVARTEKRPDKRGSNVIYAQLNYALESAVLYSSYRYFQDDWGIKAHTVDFKYRKPITERLYIQPNIRLYTQSAADFYRSMLYTTEITPAYASADYRMAKMHTNSVGVKLGYKPLSGGEFTTRVEVMRQDGEQQPDDAVGVQKDAGVFPTLDAVLFHIGYTLAF
ncbi:MAG: hypothetical protein A3H31_11510 [Gallionellales bacterium RIFCSPLOWO2_02_FULL_57_47]|nr:MAG: hypothetical protein A3H31_11510 [Gallionellales bacterium RIFCSPLOWO2_02_FULL_57_47]OGT17015.1 MAG: hypothetical protein A3J49_15645 [Gallionellales bacterium RIFCSPHIGHO2_02_FULL_57_16]